MNECALFCVKCAHGTYHLKGQFIPFLMICNTLYHICVLDNIRLVQSASIIGQYNRPV